MTIWTFKGLGIGALCLSLAGCDAIDGINIGLGTQATPLAVAEMAGGAVTLVPPTGFCVDPKSLRQNFALMARCDVLGGDGGQGMPPALITATTIASEAGSTVVPAQPGTGAETVLDRRDAPLLSMAQVKGIPPIADAHDVYWRGTGQIGEQTVGLAIYQASGSTALGPLAPELLVQTMQRSHNRTTASAAAKQDNSATLDTNPG